MSKFDKDPSEIIAELVSQLSYDSTNRWTADGQGAMAAILGFHQPASDDDSGIWKHPTAGEFHDSKMASVVGICIEKYYSQVAGPDMLITVNRMYSLIFPLAANLHGLLMESDAPESERQAVNEIIDDANRLMDKCKELLLDSDLI